MYHLQNTNKWYKKFKETRDSEYSYQNKLDKTCFQHDMAYGDFKDLTRRTASDKILRDKSFDFTKDPKYDGYQRELTSMVYKGFDKITSGSGIKNKNMSDQQLVENYTNQLLENSRKEKYADLL